AYVAWRSERAVGPPARLRRAPSDDLLDPDRHVRRGTPARGRVVLEDLEAVADRQDALTVLGMLDADRREARVHRPLEAVRGVLHLGLDHVEQAGQVEPLGL